MAEDYIDITPKGIDDRGRGYSGVNKTVFQDNEIRDIMQNPSNLTREGILKEIDQWKTSGNKHVILKFEAMIARCKNIAPSGLTSNGEIIYRRDNEGKPAWIGPVQEKAPPVSPPPPLIKKKGKR